MQIVAGSFPSRAEAERALDSLHLLGVVGSEVYIIEGSDRDGYDRQHRTMPGSVVRGLMAGLLAGIAAGAALMAFARVNPFVDHGPLVWYIGLIVVVAAGTGAIAGLRNIGASHDEAKLFEEARKNGSVIAAIEVLNPNDDRVAQALAERGARNVRSGRWQPRGWKHSFPANTAPRHHMEG